jgi:hypothetical protein
MIPTLGPLAVRGGARIALAHLLGECCPALVALTYAAKGVRGDLRQPASSRAMTHAGVVRPGFDFGTHELSDQQRFHLFEIVEDDIRESPLS